MNVAFASDMELFQIYTMLSYLLDEAFIISETKHYNSGRQHLAPEMII